MRKRSVRWWFPGLLLAPGALLLLGVWLFLDVHRQRRVELTLATGLITALVLLLWAVALSGLERRTRLGILAGALVVAGTLAVCFRIRGVTGDLVPIFEWRFSTDSTALPEPKQPEGSPSVQETPWLDFPQFLGPGRRATIRGIRLARDWEARPPRLLWRREVGPGWSGFSVVGNSAYTQEQHGEKETVACYSLLEGELQWIHAYKARYDTVLGGLGPRATPTVSGDRLYAMGATGILSCLDRKTGEPHWVRRVLEDHGASLRDWGASGSPLVIGNIVVVSAGGSPGHSLVSYDKQTGEPVWHGGSDRSGYSSPVLAELAGVPQILIFNHASVASHDPRTGRVLWEVPWQSSHPNVAQPRPVPGNRVLVSTGYGVGCALFEVKRAGEEAPAGGAGLRVEEVWRTRSLKAKFANFVDHEGFVYGLDDGIMVCVDLATGERTWKAGRYGHGQLVLVEDLLLVTAESGDVALVEATPEEHREPTRFHAVDGKTWNTPAFPAPYLLIRNDEEAACYELPLAATPGAGSGD